MAPKGNAKAQAAREAKASRENDKKAKNDATKDAVEAAEWDKGAKKEKGIDAKAKAAAAKDAKAERDRLLAEEEAATASKPKPVAKAGSKPVKKTVPAAAATQSPSGSGSQTPRDSLPSTPKRGDIPSFEEALHEPIDSFSASNIDDALSLLSLVNEKQDKASVGSRAGQIDSHPERRFKAAFAAYKERELPILRKERPGLRLQQYEEVLFKDFKRDPSNPFNQATVAFDATKEEKVDALRKLREETERRLKDEGA